MATQSAACTKCDYFGTDLKHFYLGDHQYSAWLCPDCRRRRGLD